MPEPEAAALDRAHYVLPNDTPFLNLKASEAFKGLTDKEKKYSYHLSRASWVGGLIVYVQTSPESPLIFCLLHKIFSSQPVEQIKKIALEKCKITEEEFKSFLVYAAGVFSNSGNYKGFGDTKFVPQIDKEKLKALCLCCKAGTDDTALITKLWNKCGDKIVDLSTPCSRLGFGDKGVTTYHSKNITKDDAKKISGFLEEKKIEPWNSRLFKTVKDGKTVFEIRLASVIEESDALIPYQDISVLITKGDYSALLERVVPHLKETEKHAANAEQKAMLNKYIEHFQTGSVLAHKEGSTHWIKDKGPAVESYIGFIENYRDPDGARSEFEGFVAAVNREQSKKLTILVDKAVEILPLLPWGKAYEKNEFLKPDFTSLDVLAFSGSGVPAGINIPNYDDIRQNVGFKNVSLGNVISAVPKTKINFLSDKDENMFKTYFGDSFEVQVALHELLGHGSGKLFQQNDDGTFNFDENNTEDIVNGGKVKSYYKAGQTWSSVFKALASAYEECRAEAVGYVLCCYPNILQIFGLTGEKAEDVKYVNWMSEIRAGLVGLEMYDPESKGWGQAHSYARYVLMRVAMQAGQGFVKIEQITAEDGKADLRFTLDRSKIDSVGKPAIELFLKKLQYYKSVADAVGGKVLFDSYNVDEVALTWRKIVIDRKQPRRIMVQPNILMDTQGNVQLKEYPETAEGAIASNVERYANEPKLIADMIALCEKDKHHFGVE